MINVSESMKTPFQTALKLLEKREHNTIELQQKLQKKYPDQPETIEQTLQELKERNWLSDERYCESFIHDQLLTTKPGPQIIIHKLTQKGVSNELAKTQVEKYYPKEKQLQIAQNLAQKKHDEILRRGKLTKTIEKQQKIITYLVNKGFSFEIAKQAITTKPPC